MPGTPIGPGFPMPKFPDPEGHLDPMERAIRARQKEAEERKKRTLATFDLVAKTGTGPKNYSLDGFRSSDCKFSLHSLIY